MDVPVAGAAPTPTPDPTPEPAPAGETAPARVVSSAAEGRGAAVRSSLATQQSAGTLSPVVAKLFNAAAQNVEVSFQVTTNPDEVVTVFTDRSTGKEIIQFPSQALIALAEMYDKDAGKVLDKSA